MDVSVQEDVPHVQAKFKSTNESFVVPGHPFSIPQSLDHEELNKLVNEIVDGDEEKGFDFLINGELLRTTIGEHLKDRLISNETIVEIECIERNPPPVSLDVMEHSDWVSCVNCHQKYILSGSYDNKVYIWCDGGQVAVMEGHNKPVTDVKWVSDVIFLSASQDQTIFLWKWSENDQCSDLVYCYKGHAQSVEQLAVNPSRTKFCSVSWDKHLKIWECTIGSGEDNISDNNEGDPEIPVKKRKTAKGNEKAATKTPLVTLAGHTQPVKTVVWPHEGEIFTAGYDHCIRVWDLESRTTTSTLQGNKVFLDIAYASHNNVIASGSTDGHVRLWDARQQGSALVQSTFHPHKGWVSAVEWSPCHEHQLVSCSYDHTVRVWDIRSSRSPLHSLNTHSDKVLCLDWSINKVLASGSADNTLRTYAVT